MQDFWGRNKQGLVTYYFYRTALQFYDQNIFSKDAIFLWDNAQDIAKSWYLRYETERQANFYV